MCEKCIQYIAKTTDWIVVAEADWVESNYKALLGLLNERFGSIMKRTIETYGIEEVNKALFDDEETTFYNQVADVLWKLFLIGQQYEQASVKEEIKQLEALASLDFDLSFTIDTTPATNYASVRAGELIKWVDESIKLEMQNIIQKSLNDWRTQQYLAEYIYDKFSQYNETRSALIAKQETNLAIAWWRYEQFEQEKVKFNADGRKKAYTQDDDNVRESHRANADAGWILATELFPWTGSMHDPFGYNCRCRVTYRIFLPSWS